MLLFGDEGVGVDSGLKAVEKDPAKRQETEKTQRSQNR